VTPAQILELARAGVKPIVLRALRQKPLSRAELLRLSAEGHKEAVLIALLKAVGADFKPDANDALELVRKGLPSAVVKQLRSGSGAAPNEWRDPASSFAVRYPDGYTIDPKRLQAFHQAGHRWVLAIGRNANAQADFSVVGLKGSADDMLKLIARVYRNDLNTTFDVGRKRNVELRVGQTKFPAVLATGDLRFADGSEARWEGLFLQTDSGLRGILCTASKLTWDAAANDRRVLFTSFQFKPAGTGAGRGQELPGGPAPGGEGGLPGGPGLPGNQPQGSTWRLPDNSLQLVDPKSFSPNAGTVANVQKSGAGFFQFFASDQKLGALLLGLAWTGQRYQNLSDVEKGMAEFHKGLGATWTRTGGQPIDWTYPNGRNTKAALLTGTDIAAQRRGKWVMLVVPTGDGFRGLMLSVVEQNWERSKAVREFLLKNAKIGPPTGAARKPEGGQDLPGGAGGGLPGGDPGAAAARSSGPPGRHGTVPFRSATRRATKPIPTSRSISRRAMAGSDTSPRMATRPVFLPAWRSTRAKSRPSTPLGSSSPLSTASPRGPQRGSCSRKSSRSFSVRASTRAARSPCRTARSSTGRRASSGRRRGSGWSSLRGLRSSGSSSPRSERSSFAA